MEKFDTIAALSTPAGAGGIAVIRISGDEAIEVAEPNFVSKIPLSEQKPYTLQFGRITDEDGFYVDDVLVSVFHAPMSYTGENMVEISCHGSMAVVKVILDILIKNGASMAREGEFTKRAFLNGKLDLSQAEAVIDIINAEDEYNLYTSENQLHGALKEKITKIRELLIDTTASIIAKLDYPDEDFDELSLTEISDGISSAIMQIDSLLDTYKTGKLIRDGAKIVIAGKPNVGKSSLLNALLRENRAIVTDIAGTTRDVIEDYLSIDGLKARIIDTAGIRKSDDAVEAIGIERAKVAISEADLVLFILDGTVPADMEDIEIAAQLTDKPVILLYNKADISKPADFKGLEALLPPAKAFSISAKLRTGLEAVVKEMKRCILEGDINPKYDLYITNERHYQSLVHAGIHLKKALTDLELGVFPDIISIEIENAVSSLGEISGMTVNEEIVDRIFSRFCLGK